MSRITEFISRIFHNDRMTSDADENRPEGDLMMCNSENLNANRSTEATSIEDLSFEVIELIFTYLDVCSLKSCLTASKKFRDVIIYSPILMDKLEFKFDNDNWQVYVPFIVKYGPQIRSVKFVVYNEFSMFLKILIFMPNVKKLSIQVESKEDLNTEKLDNSTVLEQLKSSFDCQRNIAPYLEKLEDLKIIFSDCNSEEIIYKLLSCKNLRKFYFCSRLSELNYEPLSSLLSHQNNLKHLELEVMNLNRIFALNKMNFRLKSFTFTTYFHINYDCEDVKEFLLTQSDCLEELKIFPWQYETGILNQIAMLKNLKKLTTEGLLPYFKGHFVDPAFTHNLSHLRVTDAITNEYFDHIDLSPFPNLRCLNVRLVKKNVKVTANPLRNLMNLKEFHIDSHDQGLLQHLTSSSLENLVMPYDKILYDTKTWQQMAQNLPNLKHLTIVNIKHDQFFTFLIKNHKKIITTMTKFLNNDGLKKIEIHNELHDVLKLFIKNGEVKKAKGYFCNTKPILITKQKILKNNFKEFNLTRITEEEYFEKHDFWDSFEVKTPLVVPLCEAYKY